MPALRAVLVTPLSGPLARFGAAGAAALRLWATRAPGLGAPWTAVDLEAVDAHPAAGAAMRAAAARRPDLLFGPYGSGPAVAALAATGRAVWNHGGASGRLRRPAFGPAVNVPDPAAAYFAGAFQAIRAAGPAGGRVALLWCTTGFGRETRWAPPQGARYHVAGASPGAASATSTGCAPPPGAPSAC